MNVFEGLNHHFNFSNAVVTTGTFDGVHLGHQKIINRMLSLAKEINGETVLITFYPHPRMVLYPEDNDLQFLTIQEEKIELLKKFGIQNLIVIPFSKEFSRLSSLDFVRNILVNQIGTKKLVIGHDHHFGRNREGSFAHLKEFGPLYGFEVEEISAEDIDEIAISSSKIRNALKNGDLKTATKFLGYNYLLSGTVEKGEGRGKVIGFPTANLKLDEKLKLIPENGVYAVSVKWKNTIYKGVLNIGVKPTFGGMNKTIEVHILNFENNIYNDTVTLYFIEKLRNEKRFSDVKELVAQIEKDIEHAAKF